MRDSLWQQRLYAILVTVSIAKGCDFVGVGCCEERIYYLLASISVSSSGRWMTVLGPVVVGQCCLSRAALSRRSS